ncbi:MAG: hypothetical protein JSU00_26255 [Acidobacteria bacterium]|nr:hypothetical protein [Acidobacteriota bacterium]
MAASTPLSGLDRLAVPAAVRADLGDFIQQLVGFYRDDLKSITVFGSAISGGYSESRSDLNLLVIYSDLNIADLESVAKLAQRWFRKRRFAPRFVSEQNFSRSARFFQIDLLEMREAHVTVFGPDPLAAVELCRADLHWQLSHEVKRMRMRLKQQYWRAAGDSGALRTILVRRFSSLAHLMQALLFLERGTVVLAMADIVAAAVDAWSLDREFCERMLALKQGRWKPRGEELTAAFGQLMEAVRRIDDESDRVAV